jgi:hypothetical protein
LKGARGVLPDASAGLDSVIGAGVDVMPTVLTQSPRRIRRTRKVLHAEMREGLPFSAESISPRGLEIVRVLNDVFDKLPSGAIVETGDLPCPPAEPISQVD